MKKLYLLVIMMMTTISMSQTNCASNEPSSANEKVSSQKKKPDKNLNLSIFLDLSDRIDQKKYSNQTMEIYQRDLGYIKSLAEAFQEHLSNSRINGMDDQIQLLFEPEPKDAQINDLAKQMRFVFNKSTVSPKAISNITSTYVSCSNKIYQVALKENKYIGADIWTFFKNKVKDQCIKPNHRNILVILTDGYMFHQDNKLKVKNQTSYLTPELIRNFRLNNSNFANRMDSEKIGFLPPISGLQNLKVLVIGINPQKGKNFEEDVIKKYWGDWLKKMGVQDYEIKGNDLPTYMDTIIKRTVLTK